MEHKPKRFVIEAFNYFIRDYRDNDLMRPNIKAEKIEKFEKLRTAYIIGLCSEREALRELTR